LSEVTAALCARLGVVPRVAPMCDQPVRTMVATPQGELAFQHYFVRDRCEPAVTGFRFAGIESARPSPTLAGALADPTLEAIVVCPSNPFVSIDPILAIAGVEQALREAAVPIVAVSPIIAGAALKGPAAKMMRELRVPVTAVEVARHYARRNLLDGFLLDRGDEALRAEVEALGVAVHVTDTVMVSLEDRERVAGEVLALARSLS
jgi:LPPG:FO 2-phospho-L-lactate transferase